MGHFLSILQMGELRLKKEKKWLKKEKKFMQRVEIVPTTVYLLLTFHPFSSFPSFFALYKFCLACSEASLARSCYPSSPHFRFSLQVSTLRLGYLIHITFFFSSSSTQAFSWRLSFRVVFANHAAETRHLSS